MSDLIGSRSAGGATAPIRRRLMTMMLLTSTVGIAATCAAFVAYDIVASRRQMLEQVATLSRVIAANSTAALAFRDEEDAQEVLTALRTEPSIDAAALYDRDGNIFARYPATRPADAFPSTLQPEGFQFGGGYLEGFQSVAEQSDRPLGALYLRSDMRAVYERFWSYWTIAAVAMAGGVLLAYFLSRILQQRISAPILSLVDTARAVYERADFNVRAPLTGEAEFRLLTNAFNEMLGRIAAQNSALREGEERLRAVLNSALSAVVVMDRDGLIVDWNAHAENIFGWPREEAIGRMLADTIIPERDREGHRRGLARFLATGSGPVMNRTIEMSALRRDGREFPVELSISVIHEPGSVSFCGFLTDITERKLAQSRVQDQLARLDLLQRTTRAIGERQDLRSIFQVILRNLEDNLPIDFGCVCAYDRATQALTVASIGTSSAARAAQLGIAIELPLPIDKEGMARWVSGALFYEPRVGEVHVPFLQRVAAARLQSLVAAPLVVENEVFGVLLAARVAPDAFSSADCEFLRQLSEHVALAAHQVRLYTTLQRTYEDLQVSQQTILQQERLRALGQMASGIAHDINNAISPVSLYTEALLEREPGLSERAREYLRVIQRSIDDVGQTVARMREFYRQRDQVADLSPVEINPLIDQVLNLTRARWSDVPQERGVVIGVHKELAESLPRLLGIESDIRDALTNLIFNAVDAMPGGGKLTLRTRVGMTPELAGTNAAPVVELEVTDTGTGMDEDTRRRCLEPFFTTKGERGTGMGLAMVYGMVKRHGGQIEIDSAPGVGTTVRLRFTAAPLSHSPQVHLSVESRSPGRLRLLVIDDDPLVGQSLTHVLSAEGHYVTAADGGQAGIDLFAASIANNEPFDVVMTDLGMPYVDGRAVAAAVKTLSPRTPVLLLTGWGQRLATEQSVPPHVDRVLSKPPKLAELRTAFAELLAASTTLENA